MTDPDRGERPRSDVSTVPLQGGYVAKQCPVRAELDHDTTRGEIEQVPRGVAVQARIDDGRAFEDDVLATVLANHADAVQVTAFERAEAQAQTRAALQSGASVIVGAYLPDDLDLRRTGRPDLLVRHADGWVPADVKHHTLTESNDKGQLLVSPLEGPLSPADAEEADGVRCKHNRFEQDGLQLAHYWRMLQREGFAASGPAMGGIVDRSRFLWWIDLDEPVWKLWWAPEAVSTMVWYDHEFAFRLDVISHTLARNADSALDRKVVPVWTKECSTCPWQQVCRTELEADDHVSLLPGSTYGKFVWHRRLGQLTRAAVANLDVPTARIVSGDRSTASTVDVASILEAARDWPPETLIDELMDKRKKTARTRLADAGISTVGDLSRLDPATAAYSAAKVGHLPTLIDQARAATSGHPWLGRGISRLKVTRADVEIDVDMENTGAGCYLWGALVSGDDDLNDGYVPFVSWEPLDADGEAAVFARFWSWLANIRERTGRAGRTFAAYYYTSAENTQMRRIASAGAPGVPSPEEVEAFLASDEWVDLYTVFTSQIVTGRGAGLKTVAPIAGFHWRDEDPGGDQSTVWYQDAVHAEDEAERDSNRRRLLAYNEDDVRATAALRQWMSGKGQQLANIADWQAP